MQVDKVIAIIDDHLISTGKRFIGLRAATNLLNAQSTENVDLKEILEENQIPHAYQTEDKPKRWRIPHSNQELYKAKRSEFLSNTRIEKKVELKETSPKFSFKHIVVLVILGYLAFYFLVGDSRSNSSNSTANPLQLTASPTLMKCMNT